MPAQPAQNNPVPALDSPKGAFPSRRRLLPGRGLIWQLFFVTILPLTALVLVVAFGSLAVHQNAMRALVGERDERAVRTAAAALEEQLNHRLLAVRSLALLAENTAPDRLDKILAAPDYLLPEFDTGLAFFTPDGSLENAVGDQEFWQSISGAIAPPIQDLLSKDGPDTFISSTFTHPASAEPLILVLAASPGRQQVAAGAFSAAAMVRHTLTDAFTDGPQAAVLMLDGEKRVLYQSGSFASPGQSRDHPGIAEALGGERGTSYVQVDGSEHVVAYSPVAPLGWALVLEEPWDTMASPALRSSQLAPLVLAPVLILALAALWFGVRQIIKPLQTLESRAASLASGNFKAIEAPVGGIEEIRQLQVELIHLAQTVQTAQQSLHGYIGAITTAQEDERRRLARELHDDTIQALIALKQRVQLAQMARPADSESSSLKEIALLTEQTIENLRRLTRALRPIYLEDLGLVTALEMLARETGLNTNIPVEFQRQGSERRLEPAAELALYRIAQEALSNVTRHAQASRAALSITFTAQAVRMQVSDNGAGFTVPRSPAEFAPSGHYGLLGLHERAELIGAALEIKSTPGRGTQLSVDLPVPPLTLQN